MIKIKTTKGKNSYLKCDENIRQYYDLATDKLTFMKDIDKLKILKEITLDILNQVENDTEEEYLINNIHRELVDYTNYYKRG